MDCRSTASSTVGVCSTARRKRNHVVSGMRRAACGGRSPRSSTISPKPPLSSSRSVARRSCSRHFCGEFSPQRTHSSRSNSIPAAAADCGSRASLASTTAQNSPRPVAAASAANSKVVRPEEAGPQISVRQPRGRPPVRASIAAMPLETISGAGRTANREAGVTPASLESMKGRKSSLRRARLGEKLRPGRLRADFGRIFIKNKRAALGRRSGNHCGRHRFLGKFQGTPGLGSPGGVFAFYSPLRILRPPAEIVKLRLKNPSSRPIPDCLPWHPPSV